MQNKYYQKPNTSISCNFFLSIYIKMTTKYYKKKIKKSS